ncbi:MAG: ABC transporter C-terminal domain-containing protein [Gammaproteobacteria bacterium]
MSSWDDIRAGQEKGDRLVMLVEFANLEDRIEALEARVALAHQALDNNDVFSRMLLGRIEELERRLVENGIGVQ